MKKLYTYVLIAIFLQACGGTPQPEKTKPTGEWVWINHILYQQVDNGTLSKKELNYKFIKTKNICKIDSLKVSIPSPSCYVVPAPDCSYYTGMARGICMAEGPTERCDYSSVDAAKNAQKEIFKACMQIEDWIQVWQPYKKPINHTTR